MIYLLRHGETEYNREGRIQGWRHSDLTNIGMAQARRMGERLRGLIEDPHAWAIIASPQGRAVRSAELVREALGVATPIETLEGLKEVTLGSWEGSTYDDIEAAFPERMAGSTRYDRFFRSPDGDTYETLAGRVGEALARVQAHPASGCIVVSHGVSGRVFRGLYAGMARDAMLKLEAPQTAFFRLHDGRIERVECESAEA